MKLLDQLRINSAKVAAASSTVRIDQAGIGRVADSLEHDSSGHDGFEIGKDGQADGPFRDLDGGERLAAVVTYGAVNFGSGWHDVIVKRPGLSGSANSAAAVREQFERAGPWTAGELCELDEQACATVFGQDLDGVAGDLMVLFSASLRALGRQLLEQHDGSFTTLVAAAGGSAERLVEQLADGDAYRDQDSWGGLELPYLKRAQCCAKDLAVAFGGQGPGSFGDLDRLTALADNVLPHVLRLEGAIVLPDDLLARIEAGDILDTNSVAVVEMRAATIDAVEQIVARLAERGTRMSAVEVDGVMYRRGREPRYKTHRRPRVRCTAF